MFRDAVLNESLDPIFEGTPEEAKKWLQERSNDWAKMKVSPEPFIRIISVEEYLEI
jgi:hypothetical protein